MGVRWDAVVEDNGFWLDPTVPSRESQEAGANRPVQVWLFGSLADLFVQRPLTVEFRGPFSVGDVIAELGRRGGRAFLDRVMDPCGVMVRNCRVFVNGQSVEDASTPVRTQASQTDVELILLTAAEGG